MACSSNLTSLMMTAAGSFVTNGDLAGTFGTAPLSSLASAPLSITDALTGESLAPTLATVVSSIGTLSGQPWATALGSALTSMAGAGFSDTMVNAWNALPTNAADGALTDVIGGFGKTVNSVLTTASGAGLNDALSYATSWPGKIIGGTGSLVGGNLIGDAKKFGTILGASSGYVETANQFINSAANSDFLSTTFNGFNNIVSGGLADVNLDMSSFGTDISKIGSAIDFSALDNLGSPGQLIKNISNQGTLGPLYDSIASIQVDQQTAQAIGASLTSTAVQTLQQNGSISISALGLDINNIAQQGASLPPTLQKKLYTVLEELPTDSVQQIKGILNNTQDAVLKGNDLLDPTKLLADSFDTLTTPVRTASVGFRAIYEDTNGDINPQLNNLGGNLKGVLPNNLAVANDALARSLRQVKNISNTDSTSLSASLLELETLKDLPLVENQSEYVTTAVKNYWESSYSTDSTTGISLGTGNNGQLVLSDMVGFAAGFNSAAPLKNNATLLQTLTDNGDLDAFTDPQGVYDTIEEFCAGTFGPVNVPPWTVTITAGYVGAGTYTGATSADAFEDAWVNGIVPAVQTLIEGFSANATAQQVVSNTARYSDQLAREYINQGRIDQADPTTVPASDNTAISFAQNLPTLGLDTTEGGSAEILERIVNFDSLGGQCVIAAMREGRNAARLGNANIQQDVSISTTGVTTAGTLVDSTYTKAEAQSTIIRS